jgi:hypothetical protein
MTIPPISIPDFYGDFRDAADEGRRRGSRRAADAYAASGKYSAALSAIDPDDTEGRKAMADRAALAYGQSFAGALAKRDYGNAEEAAVTNGDPQGVVAARKAMQEEKTEKLAEDHRTLGEYRNLLTVIGEMPTDQQQNAYTSLLDRAKREADAAHGNADWIDQLPQQYNPYIGRMLEAKLLSAQEMIANDAKERGYDLQTASLAETARHNRAGEGIAAFSAQTARENAGKPQRRQFYPDTAALAGNYAKRMQDANTVMMEMEAKGIDPNVVYTIGQIGGGGAPVQTYRQAMRAFVNSTLRKESGAAISPSEFDSAKKQYFPVPGDKPETIRRKQAARQAAIDGMIHESQGYYDEYFGGDAGGEAAGADAGEQDDFVLDPATHRYVPNPNKAR